MKKLERGDVCKVLRTARCALVLEQLVELDHMAAHTIGKVGLDPCAAKRRRRERRSRK